MQALLQQLNPDWEQRLFEDNNLIEDVAPDSDVYISDSVTEKFKVRIKNQQVVLKL